MADLDDFFAKKDRKKNKGKKFTTADEIARKLEETGKKVEKTKKEKPTPTPQVPGQEGEEQVIEIPEDDEWKEFEEEKKDYTGLKIGNLQISEVPPQDGDDDGEEEGGMEENEAGEMIPRKKVQSGPWKMVSNQPEPAESQPAPVVQERPKKQESATPGSYVPPHLRDGGRPKEPSHTPLTGQRLKNRTAPDINNEEFFPTLNAAKTTEPAGAWGKKRRDDGGNFEEVRNSKSHTGRGYADVANKLPPGGGGPKLNLGNKYDALDDHDHDQS